MCKFFVKIEEILLFGYLNCCSLLFCVFVNMFEDLNEVIDVWIVYWKDMIFFKLSFDKFIVNGVMKIFDVCDV